MENKEICKELLETLLDIKIERIEFPEIQKELSASYHGKSIRLDVFASDPTRNFDIEMQMVRHKGLPKRMRYYQSLMDIDALLKGEKYTELKANYVMFICMFDPFGEDLPVYFFENTCKQKTDLKLGDKSFKICYNVNAFAKENNSKVKAFLEYLKTQNAKDDFTQRLDNIVKRAKASDSIRSDYMMRNIALDDYFDRGIAQGISRGAHDARIETARALLVCGDKFEKISRVTSLSLAEVHALAKHQ